MNYKKYFKKNNLITIEQFFKFMQNRFMYGWVDKDNNIFYGNNNPVDFSLQRPIELFKSHVGNCWDMAELYRCFFKYMTSLKFETYYLFYDDNAGCPSHSIFAFYNNNKVYWFEPMFNDESYYYSGIHDFKNINELLQDAKKRFIDKSLISDLIPENYNNNNFYIYKYKKPKAHINGFQMREHINKSILINI